MKKAIIVVVILLLAAGVLRGWFGVSGPHRDNDSRKIDIDLSVDPGKMKDDAESVKEKSVELKDKLKHEIKDHERGGQ